MLCGYLSNHPADVLGKNVIELGSGTGIVGLMAAKIGSCKYLNVVTLYINYICALIFRWLSDVDRQADCNDRTEKKFKAQFKG